MIKAVMYCCKVLGIIGLARFLNHPMKFFYAFRILHQGNIHPTAKPKPVGNSVACSIDLLPVA